jgi:hypothetical protein
LASDMLAHPGLRDMNPVSRRIGSISRRHQNEFVRLVAISAAYQHGYRLAVVDCQLAVAAA